MFVLQMLKITFLLVIVFKSTNTSILLYDQIIAFGDSNTDTQNVYNFSGARWPIPPYYQGRFSDGPVWIDRLGISNVSNFAYGGATSDNELVQGYTAFSLLVPGVRQQIRLFQNRTNVSLMNFDRTLFVVWIGGNDYFRNLSLSPSIVVSSLMRNVQDLIGLGGKHFLIMNQPPFHRQPVPIPSIYTNFLSTLVTNHNQNLSESIRFFEKNNSNVTFHLVDIYSLINRILDNLLTYGINNTNICWTTSTTSGITQLYNNTDNSMFIDQYHYTTRVHRFIAEEIRPMISSNRQTIVRCSTILFVISVGFSFFH